MTTCSFNTISLPEPCPKFHLPITNLCTTARFNLRPNMEQARIRSKTTSLARINEEQDAVVMMEEKKSPEVDESVIMSQPEQIVRLIKGLAERPLGSALDVIAPPGTPLSQASLRLFLLAVAVLALLPGGSWEWWLSKSAVCVGLVFLSAILFIFSSFVE